MGFSCASKMLSRVLGRLGSQLKWEILGLDAPVTECGLRQVNLQSINLKKKVNSVSLVMYQNWRLRPQLKATILASKSEAPEADLHLQLLACLAKREPRHAFNSTFNQISFNPVACHRLETNVFLLAANSGRCRHSFSPDCLSSASCHALFSLQS